VIFVGEVYKPEDIVRGKKRSSDLSPNLNRITPSGLQELMRELRLLRTEVNKIKQVLRTNGIAIE
jgi:biotin operon repressor